MRKLVYVNAEDDILFSLKDARVVDNTADELDIPELKTQVAFIEEPTAEDRKIAEANKARVRKMKEKRQGK